MHTSRVLGMTTCAAAVAALLLPQEAAVGATVCNFRVVQATKKLSLTGDCVLKSPVQPVQDGWTIDGNGHTITADATGGFTGPIIASQAGTAGAAPVTMNVEHLTIRAVDFGNATGRVAGILFDGAQGRVHDVRIYGVTRGSSGAGGFGVEADNSVGTVFGPGDRVKLDHWTTITGYGRAAVYAHGNLRLRIFRTKIGSPESIQASHDVDGVWAAGGARGYVKESLIALGHSDPASASAYGAGIRLVSTRRVELKRNIFSGTAADFAISVSNLVQQRRTTASVDCNLFRADTSTSDPYGVGVGQWVGPRTNVLLTNSTFQGHWNHRTGTISGTTVTSGPVNEPAKTTECSPIHPPTHVHAAGGNHRSEVTWRAADAPRWHPITSYRVRAMATGHPAVSRTVAPTARSTVLTGLNNKLTYKVTVTARTSNGSVTGADMLYPTKTTLKARPRIIHRGDSSRLHGRLTSADPNAQLRKRRIAIWAKPKGHAWAEIATVRTRATGAFHLRVRPHRKTVYKAVYAGHPDLASRHRRTVIVRR